MREGRGAKAPGPGPGLPLHGIDELAEGAKEAGMLAALAAGTARAVGRAAGAITNDVIAIGLEEMVPGPIGPLDELPADAIGADMDQAEAIALRIGHDPKADHALGGRQ